MKKEEKSRSKTALFSLQSYGICYIIIRTINTGEKAMSESIGKITENIIQFCRENLNIIMISGAALILLIIIIAVAVYARKNENDDDLDFDEETFIKEQQNQADKEPAEDKRTYTKKAVSREGIETLLEEIAHLPAQALKEVEIKIQGAEVKIKYACDEDKPCDDSIKTFIFKEDVKQPEKQNTKDTLYNLSIEDITKEIERAQAETSVSSVSESGEQTDVPEKSADTYCCLQNSYSEELKEDNAKCEDGPVNDRTVRKFGPENIDTTRSGKTFTEEELKEKIRD